MVTPPTTATPASTSWNDELPAGAELHDVVEEAEAHAPAATPPKRTASSSVGQRARSRAGCQSARGQPDRAPGRRRTKATPTARPPARGMGTAWTRRAASGSSMAPNRVAMRSASGVSEVADERGGGEPADDDGSAWTAASLTIPRWQAMTDIRRRPGRGPGSGRRWRRPRRRRRPARPVRRGRVDGAHDERADLAHLGRPEAARGRRRRADPDARGGVGRQRIEGDGVLVDGDADLVEELLGLLAGDAQGRHVDEHQVVVGAARDDARRRWRSSVSASTAGVLDRSAACPRGTSSLRASLKATALAAMTCISGPPWMPGKTVLSMAWARCP